MADGSDTCWDARALETVPDTYAGLGLVPRDVAAPLSVAVLEVAAPPDMAGSLEVAALPDMAAPAEVAAFPDVPAPLGVAAPAEVAALPDMAGPLDMAAPLDVAAPAEVAACLETAVSPLASAAPTDAAGVLDVAVPGDWAPGRRSAGNRAAGDLASGDRAVERRPARERAARERPATERMAEGRARERPGGQVRALGGPARGFGRMWQKSYRMGVGPGVRPRTVMAAWEQSFPGLWPSWLRGTVSVLYADTESFTVATGPRDRLVGWITLTSEQAAHGTVVSVHVLLRAHDPLCELGLVLGGSRRYDTYWMAAMSTLARRLGVAEPVVEMRSVCLDARRKWANTRNLTRSPVLPGQAWRRAMGELCRPARSGGTCLGGTTGWRGATVWRGVLAWTESGG